MVIIQNQLISYRQKKRGLNNMKRHIEVKFQMDTADARKQNMKLLKKEQ